MKKLDCSKTGVKIRETVHFFDHMNISGHAAHASYFMILSVFPTIVLLLSILRYTKLSVSDLTELIDGFVPEVLTPWIDRLINSAYQNANIAVISLAAVTALWSASKGVFAMALGLDSVYRVRESRSWLHRRAISVIYTFLFLIVLLLTLVLHVFGNTILAMIPPSENPVVVFVMGILDLRFILLLILQTVLFTAVYAFLPSTRNHVRDSISGALLASLGWMIFSDLFSIYVQNYNSYSTIYGSVYAVALSMLWLYCCMFIVFCGGALNHFLMEKLKKS